MTTVICDPSICVTEDDHFENCLGFVKDDRREPAETCHDCGGWDC